MTTKKQAFFGLSQVHIAFHKADGTFDKPVHIPGAVSFTPSTVGDNSTFAADNDPNYFAHSTNGGYTGDITLVDFPDEVVAKMYGWEITANGALREVANGKPTAFALMFEEDGNMTSKRYVYYNVVAGRSAREMQTTADTTEPAPSVASLTMRQFEIDGKPVIKDSMAKTDENAAAFESFYTTVNGQTEGA